MPPNRFRREKREVTPFNEEPVVPEDIPASWRHIEAPPNFTWVSQDELAGMGWPKSRDQVRFLVDQGIDHLITLSADKIPPHYAFPDLQWWLIPVEDFHGPSMGDIKKFLNIMDEARRNGEAVGVHCAEGRGRTGVMCACFLIYYHDLRPWDAIRIMRRQRPGSVERKTQEDTVVRFFHLLQDYGKSALEDLEEKDKEWREMQRRQKDQMNMMSFENKLLTHTSSFYGNLQTTDAKIQRLEKAERMRRCRSMPKMTQEVEESDKLEINFKQHLQNFYSDKARCKSQTRDRDTPERPDSRGARAVTPGRSLVDGLRKTNNRKGEGRDLEAKKQEEDKACDFTKHFKDFLAGNTNASVKRARSFSQPKDKEEKAAKLDLAQKEATDPTSKDAKDTSENQPVTKPEIVIKSDDDEADDEAVSDEDDEDKGESGDSGFTSRNSSSVDEFAHHESSDGDSSKQGESEGDDNESESDLSDTKSETSSESQSPRPPQPSYRPKYTVDSSSTYSYYTRVRSRAKARAEAEAAASSASVITKHNTDNQSTAMDNDRQRANQKVPEIESSYRIQSLPDPLRRRAKTVDRDMCVTVTVTESALNNVSNTSSGGGSNNNNYFRYRKYRHTNSNEPLTLSMREELTSNNSNHYQNEKPSRSNNDNEDNSHATSASNRTYRRTLSREERAKSEHQNLNELRSSQLNDNHRGYFIQSANAFTTSAASPMSSYRVRSRLRSGKASAYPDNSLNLTAFSPSYFNRDNWRRTNSRFKNSRFVSSYSRETFV